jgi:Mrp family chromosome partitioning ATPase
MDSGMAMTGPSFAPPAIGSVNSAGVVPSGKPVAPSPRPGPKPLADDGATPLRILTYLRLHWLMIAFCGTLLGGVGAMVAWEVLASKYESYALLQVSSVPTALANPNNPHQARTDFATYVKTTAALLKSEFVLNAALRDIKDLPTIKAQKDPIKFLDEEIQVTWQDGSEVIRITFKGTIPDDAKLIVDAVQKAFMANVIQRDVREKRAFLEKLEQAQAEMKRILNQSAKKTAVSDGVVPVAKTDNPPPAAPVPPPAPALLPSDVLVRIDPRILINRIVNLQQQVDQLPLTLNDYKRREAVLKEKLKALQEAPVPQAIIDMIDKDQDVIVEKILLNRAKAEYERWLYAGDPNNPTPAVLELKAAYEAQQKKWEDKKKEKLDTYDGQRRREQASKIAAELEEVIRTGQRYQEQYNYAKEQLEKAGKQLLELPLPTEQNGIVPVKLDEKMTYTPEASALDTTDSIYRELVRQYYQKFWELNSPQRVNVLQSASHPVQRDVKKQYLGTGLAGVMGFVVIALGVVAYETYTRRVSSLADVKAALSSPVVGVIPYHPAEAMGRDPLKRAAANEAIDKLRAYVAQTWLSRGATAIAVTSSIGDEGKAFTAFGLASSLAQAGYRTLLVDFDLREPVLHSFAGIPNLAGVCELLRSETDLRSAIQFLPNGLHLLPAGKWSDEARKAATGEKLETVLGKLKEPYDCVVLHGHALLTVAESVEVARRCDGVLVCARYRETAIPLLKNAAERVATMEIPYTGLVYVGATEQEALC